MHMNIMQGTSSHKSNLLDHFVSAPSFNRGFQDLL